MLFENEMLNNIRSKNLSDVLQTLRTNGECTLARLTENVDGGLTTVKKCIAQAIEYGMVLEGETAQSTGGRKAKQYLINEQYQYFLFIIVDNNDFLIRLYDFALNCVENKKVAFDMNTFFSSLCRKIDAYVGKYKVGTIAVSLPCVINNGVIVDWFYNPTMKSFNIENALNEKYDMNIVVKNDMKLTALGISRRSDIRSKNVVVMQFGHNGIGMASLVNGHLLEGCNGFAGEVGYITDFSKNIASISYPAKLLRNAIVFLNPETVVFYKSQRQNSFDRIYQAAIRGLPSYALPKYCVRDDYIDDIVVGLAYLINKNSYYKRKEDAENE